MTKPDANGIKEQILSRYAAKTPTSAKVFQTAAGVMPGGETRTSTFFTPHPLHLASGSGCQVIDLDGHDYVDFLNNYTVLIHGHARAEVVAAAQAQARAGCALGGAVGLASELAALLVQRLPGVDRVRFCNSGTEATMFALRAARAFSGKDLILKMEGGYHGTHDYAEVSVNSAPQSDPLSPRLDCAGVPRAILETMRTVPFNDLEAVEAVFEKEADNIAGLIVEPMIGASGCIPAREGYLAGLRELCDKYGVLLIFDEVITFRFSRGGLQLRTGVRPDLTALGKIIGGGYPIGAFGGRAEIMALFDPFRPGFIHHGGTFNGNSASLAAGVAAMKLYDGEAPEQLNALGDKLRQGFDQIFREAGLRGRAIGVGSVMGLHLTDGPVEDAVKAAEVKARTRDLLPLIHLEMINRGFYSAPRGMYVVSTAMGRSEVGACLEAFRGTLAVLRPYIEEKAAHIMI